MFLKKPKIIGITYLFSYTFLTRIQVEYKIMFEATANHKGYFFARKVNEIDNRVRKYHV
jgi:hypothetical protein